MGKVERKCQDSPKEANFGWGIRHLQATCMFLCLMSLIIVRSSMSVAVLAMTDQRRLNDSSVQIFDWDKKTQGMILSSFFWGYTIMQIPAGVLAKKFGGKPILLVALLSNALLSLMLPFLVGWGGWMLVCATRVCIGLSQACTFPAMHTLLGRWLPDHERTAISGLIYGGMQIGTIIAMPLSGLLAETAIGWRLIFYSLTGLTLVAGAMWQFLTASTPGEHRWMTQAEKAYIEKGFNICNEKKSLRAPWKQILKSVPVWSLVVAHIGVSTSYVLFFNEMPTYLEKGLGISLRDSSTYSALPYVGMWVGGTLATFICEKLYNHGVLSAVGCRKVFNSIGAVGISVGMVVLAFFAPNSTIVAISSLVFALTMTGFYLAGFMLNHLDLSPNFAGLLLSLTNFIANVFSVVIPLCTSIILRNDPTDLSRWRVVFLTMAGVSLGCNAIYVMFGNSTRQPWDDPEFEKKRHAHPEEMVPVMAEEKEKEANNTGDCVNVIYAWR